MYFGKSEKVKSEKVQSEKVQSQVWAKIKLAIMRCKSHYIFLLFHFYSQIANTSSLSVL